MPSGAPRLNAADWFAHANAVWQSGNLREAQRAFERVLHHDPRLTEARVNLAMLAERLGDPMAARQHLMEALASSPTHPAVTAALGAHWLRHGDVAQAVSWLERAAVQSPGNAMVLSNLGMALQLAGQTDRARTMLERSLEVSPDNPATMINLAYALLQQKRLNDGWRWLDQARRGRTIGARASCDRWHGETLTGKRILLEHEAGHGDTLQFVRYVTSLKAQGASTVALACHPALKRLLSHQAGLDLVYALNEPIPDQGWDYWAPLVSLARHLAPGPDHVPDSLPYLKLSDSLQSTWKHRITSRGRRVGLVWRGNPHFPNDKHRSLAGLDRLVPILDVSEIQFYSLQKGEAGTPPPSHLLRRISDLAPQLIDFADTAAAIAHLDLIICVDTAVAHLAGALGIPCWILLPDYLCDWRWGRDSTTSYWYPGVVRLFRQGPDALWEPVILEVADALRQWRDDPHARTP